MLSRRIASQAAPYTRLALCQPLRPLATAAAAAAAVTPRRWGSAEVNRLSYVDGVGEKAQCAEDGLGRPHWALTDVEKVIVTHKPVNDTVDRLAYGSVRMCRWAFDTLSLYRFGKLTERKVVMRCMFLETVAGVPGMVAGMLRHMTSLRRMQRDKGWIFTLLNEAENERIHLMTFMEIHQPGYVMRFAILVAQGIMFNFLFVAYMISPHFVHRFVGYLEEEAVITYTSIIKACDEGRLEKLRDVVPEIAKTYWGLRNDATFRDLINCIRADEAEHRVVNHTFADMHKLHMQRSPNPFMTSKYDAAVDEAENATTTDEKKKK